MKMQKINGNAVRWMLHSVGKSKYYVLILIPLQSAMSLISIWFALQMRTMIDSAAAKDMNGFLAAAGIIVGMMVLQMAMTAFGRFIYEWTRSGIENNLKSYIFDLLLHKDYASVSAVHSGEWMNRLTGDVSTVANNMVDILPSVIATVVGLFGAIAAIIMLQPIFAAVLVPGGCAILVVTYGFRKIMKRMHKEVREADGKVRVFLQEHLGNLMMIRTFGMEAVTVSRAKERMNAYRAVRMKRNHFSNLCSTGFGLAASFVYMGGTVYCGYQILLGKMTYGTMMAVMQLVGQVQSPFAVLTGYLPQFYNTIASAERLMEIEAFEDDCREPKSQEVVSRCYEERFDSLGLDHVTFAYKPPVQDEGREMPVVLRELSLNIRKGDYVALMGHSGCGKSTILKLLMGIYPTGNGERYLRMTDGTTEALDSSWRGLFAYVPQGNQLMSGSIREIIAFGDEKRMHEDKKIHQSLKIACAEEFISTLEDGIDTVMGERGAGLSEGQMQRIAIARAVFSERPILLLDESTSALDENTERELLRNLRSMTDKTVIIVTHRTAVLTVCDSRIIVTEDGIAVE